MSIILASHRSKNCGVFCVSCASKRLFFSSLITGACGWLGFRGFFWSLEGILINILGGKKNPCINSFLLGKQSCYFYKNGNIGIAKSLASDALFYFEKISPNDPNYHLAKSGYDLAQNILSQCKSNYQKIKSHWSWWPTPARWAFFGLSIPAFFWIIVISNNLNKSNITKSEKFTKKEYIQNSAKSNNTNSTEKNILFIGPYGQKFKLSYPDATRLQVVYNELTAHKSAISKEYDDLERRSKTIEFNRSSPMSEMGVYQFNKTVSEWNADKEIYDKKLENFNMGINNYNSELIKLGVPVN